MVKIPTYKDIVGVYIITIFFMVISSIPLCVFLMSEEFSIAMVIESTPIIFILVLFFVVGLALFISNTSNLIMLNKLNTLINNNASKTDILAFENKFKWFIMLKLILIFICGIFVLLSLFLGVFIYEIYTDAFILIKVLTGMGIVFLAFIFVGFIRFAIDHMKENNGGDLAFKDVIKGKIKGVYYTTYTEKAPPDFDSYNMLIEYYIDGETKEYLCSEAYSSKQLITLYQMKYIPLVSDGRKVRLYADSLNNVPIDENKQVSINVLGTLRDYVTKNKSK